MPRPWRIEYAGARYHVINRGNYRRVLFNGKGAAEAFERTLDEAATRFHWLVHAYTVMSNHFHLAVELTEPNLSDGMQWLQGTWIRRFNAYRRLVGRPFQGRYKALLVEPGEGFGRVCDYIHLNPVRAGLVSVARLTNYLPSSLPKFVRGTRPEWLVPVTVLAQSGGLTNTPEGWKCYLARLAFLAEDKRAQELLTSRQLSRGWCIGSASFKTEMREQHAQRGAELDRFAGLEPETVRQERIQRWEEDLQALAATANIDLNTLQGRKSHPDKVILAAALKANSSVSNGWLARRLAMGQPASVSQFVRRLQLQPAGTAAVRALLSRVKT